MALGEVHLRCVWLSGVAALRSRKISIMIGSPLVTPAEAWRFNRRNGMVSNDGT